MYRRAVAPRKALPITVVQPCLHSLLWKVVGAVKAEAVCAILWAKPHLTRVAHHVNHLPLPESKRAPLQGVVQHIYPKLTGECRSMVSFAGDRCSTGCLAACMPAGGRDRQARQCWAARTHPLGIRRMLMVYATMRISRTPAVVLPQHIPNRRAVVQHLCRAGTGTTPCMRFFFTVDVFKPMTVPQAVSVRTSLSAWPSVSC